MNIRQIKAARRWREEQARTALKGRRDAEARRHAHRAEVLARLIQIKKECAA
jgi:hypothetical protein